MCFATSLASRECGKRLPRVKHKPRMQTNEMFVRGTFPIANFTFPLEHANLKAFAERFAEEIQNSTSTLFGCRGSQKAAASERITFTRRWPRDISGSAVKT